MLMFLTTTPGKLLCAVATVVSAFGLLSAPTAHAADECTSDPGYLDLRNRELGYQSMSVQTDGSHFGPGIVSSASGENPRYGTVSDSVFSGRFLSFTITWNDNKGRAHYAATVGDDGFSHGAADGPKIPVNLWNPGLWDSTTHFTCTSSGSQPPPPQTSTATATEDVDVYESVGPDGGVNNQGILRSGNKVALLAPCKKKDWCHVSGDAVPTGSGWVWGALAF
jgi:hypothetical protein